MPACDVKPGPVLKPEPRYHPIRKLVHLLCFCIFAALPFFNIIRFDIPRQRFYFAGFELWINEFGIIFFTLMFLMFVIVASSVVYGRVYCGYLCPQMIFSEASLDLQAWLKRRITKRFSTLSPGVRNRMSGAAFYGILGLASVFLAFIFISYFVEPRDLLRRLLSFDLQTAGGVSGATVTLITFLDFTLVRQRFCTTVCPYGYLQGMLGDKNTLLVQYRDQDKECIDCRKCVRDCLMGIDIRKSPYQIECVHCGECIDACAAIMGRLGKRSLIHYTWGETGSAVETETAWYRKLGIRDGKRVVVLLVTLFYLSGILVALSMRQSVLVQIAPDRTTLYRVDDAGMVYNKFRLKVANRGRVPAQLSITVESLPGAKLTLSPNPIPLQPGESAEKTFEVAAARFPGAQDVNHIRIVTWAAPQNEEESSAQTFLMPPERRSK